jgi:hypothetical protein
MQNNTGERKASNRRRAPRCKPRSFVKLECRKGTVGLGLNLATTLMDVSETGVRLVISQELPANQEVEIVLSSYGLKQPIKRLGVIRWQLKLDDGKFCLGVEFEKRLAYVDWQNVAVPNQNI